MQFSPLFLSVKLNTTLEFCKITRFEKVMSCLRMQASPKVLINKKMETPAFEGVTGFY